jgi:hypothetical protein
MIQSSLGLRFFTLPLSRLRRALDLTNLKRREQRPQGWLPTAPEIVECRGDHEPSCCAWKMPASDGLHRRGVARSVQTARPRWDGSRGSRDNHGNLRKVAGVREASSLPALSGKGNIILLA